MHKPSFSVVSGVVVVLAVMAFISKLGSGLIPDGPENRLGPENDEFLKQAAHQEIDWRPLSEDVFSEARKRDLPIMLVVGTACSPTGRMSDKVVFMTKEVRAFLARNFVCARVDAMARPEFMNAFLPVSRAILEGGNRLGIPPDYQVWFLDSKGFMFGYAAETVAGRALDSRVFLSTLSDAANRFDHMQNSRAEPGEEQRRDLAAIASPPLTELPDVSAYAEALSRAGAGEFGGFPNNGYQRLWPAAWRFQLVAGRFDDYQRSLSPCLLSPQVDVLDGGFFTPPSNRDWTLVGFDKLAVTNAAMMQTLAMAAALRNDPQQKWFALQTFDALLNDFARDGFIAAGRIGEEDAMNRNPRSSFSPRQLRELFPDGEDREWVRENLGLKVETNSQMVPFLTRLDLPEKDSKRFESSLEKLKQYQHEFKFAGKSQMDVGGYATARMMQATRILGDNERMIKAEGLFERLDEMRTLNDVIHSKAQVSAPNPYLGDYLAYADGALQYFLATGSSVAFKNGLDVLRRGLFLFAGKESGVYTLSQTSSAPLAAQDSASPEIVDNVRESCSAQIIRLCNDYGRLLGKSGEGLRKVARDTALRFAAIAPGLGQYAGGYFCAVVQLQDSPYAVVVGKDAALTANQLARREPSRLIAPAMGAVEAPGTKPGIYVIADSGVQGPMLLEDAVKALSPRSF